MKLLGRIKSKKFLILILFLIFVLALGVRVGILCNTYDVHPANIVFGMTQAKILVEGLESLTEANEFQGAPSSLGMTIVSFWGHSMPSAVMLAGTYWVFGEYDPICVRVIWLFIDSFGCLLMFLIGKELFSRRIGLIAAFLYAIWLPIAYLSTWMFFYNLMPFITLLSLYFFIKAVRTGAIKFYVLSAISIGIGYYYSPIIMFLPLMFGLALFIYNLGKSNFRKQVANVAKMTAVMVAVVFLILSPTWGIAYHRHDLNPLTMRPMSFWGGMWQGFGEFGENPVGAVFNDWITYDQVKEWGYEVEMWGPEYDEIFKPRVLDAIREHPVWWLSLLARRVPHSIVFTSQLGIEYYPRDAEGNHIERKCQYPTIGPIIAMIKGGTFWEWVKSCPYAAFYTGLMYLFAVVPVLLSVVGIWVMRKNWRPLILVAAVTIYFAAVHIAICVSSYKNMVPINLAYIIFSAIALDYIYRRIRGDDSRSDDSRSDELAMSPTENHPKKSFH